MSDAPLVQTLPASGRKAGIVQKLDYAETQQQELGQALFDSHKVGHELPQYVAQRAAAVLAEACECFDHLACDLIEHYLLSGNRASLRNQYEKRGAYFPFYLGQLIPGRPGLFPHFRDVYRPIYDALRDFVRAMDQNLTLPGTSLQVRKLRIIRQMVNEKKHSRVLEYQAVQGERLFVEGENGSFLFLDKNFRNDHPAVRIALPEGQARRVPAYRFACNGSDVAETCGTAVHGTQMMIDRFYDLFFAPTPERAYKPEPPPIVMRMPMSPEDAVKFRPIQIDGQHSN